MKTNDDFRDIDKAMTKEIMAISEANSSSKGVTAMQMLRTKSQHVVDDLKDALPGTDQYGYRAAMQCVIDEIDKVLLTKEREQICKAFDFAYGHYPMTKTNDGEKYFNQTFPNK